MSKKTHERESYNNKNDLRSQMDFLDKTFLPLYGINSLLDTITEIKSKDLSRFDEMTSCIPQIKKLFKISIMNLGRSDNKITHTNALPILKHLCNQAFIPYELNKYQNYYTFSLAEQNKLLTVLRESANNKPGMAVIKAEPTIAEPTIKAKLHRSKPYKYFEELPYKEMNKDITIQGQPSLILAGGDFAKDIRNNLDFDLNDVFKYMACGYPSQYSVRYNGVLYGNVHIWYKNRNQKFISINLPRIPNIYRRINTIMLYDKKGTCIHSTDKADVASNVFNIRPENKCITDIHVPSWSLPYYSVSLNIPYDGKDPIYYYVNLECVILEINSRRNISENWGELTSLNQDRTIPDIPEDIGEVNVKWNILQFHVPQYARCIRNLKTKNDIRVCFNDLMAGSTNNPLFPLDVYTNLTLYKKEHVPGEICEATFEYDDNKNQDYKIDNKIFRRINGDICA